VSHLHFFYRIPSAVRQSMIFPNWMRPRDFKEVEAAVTHGSPIVLLQEPQDGQPPKDPCQWGVYAFPKDFCERISVMLGDPYSIDGASWIFPTNAF
jgi:hypothetical protein